MRNLLGFIPGFFFLNIIAIKAEGHTRLGSFGDAGVYKVIIDRNRIPEEPLTVSEKGASGEIEPVAAQPQSVFMFNKKGQKFKCLLPQPAKEIDEKDRLIDLSTEKIEAALKPVESNRGCIQLITPGWWHYKFCYNKHIQQFHMENNQPVEPIISLGVYSHSFDWSTLTQKETLLKTDRFHVQYYVNGSECDLTGGKRQTVVKFYCDNANWASDYIESVKEPESCVYEVIVQTKRLCSVPYFKKEEPVVASIVCNPVAAGKTKTPIKETVMVAETAPDDPSLSPAQLRQNLVADLMKNMVSEPLDDSDPENPVTEKLDTALEAGKTKESESRKVSENVEGTTTSSSDSEDEKRTGQLSFMDKVLLETVSSIKAQLTQDLVTQELNQREKDFMDKFLRTVDIIKQLGKPGVKRVDIIRQASDNIAEAVASLSGDMFWPEFRETVRETAEAMRMVTMELEAAKLDQAIDQGENAFGDSSESRFEFGRDDVPEPQWSALEPLSKAELDIKDTLTILDVVLKYAKDKREQLGSEGVKKLESKALVEIRKIVRYTIDPSADIRDEISDYAMHKVGKLERMLTGGSVELRKWDSFKADSEMYERFSLKWMNFRLLSPLEESFRRLFEDLYMLAGDILNSLVVLDDDTLRELINQAEDKVSTLASLLNGVELEEDFEDLLEEGVKIVRNVVQRVRLSEPEDLPREAVEDGRISKPSTLDERPSTSPAPVETGVRTKPRVITNYQGEDSDIDLINSNGELTADEKAVLLLMSRSFKESKEAGALDKSGKDGRERKAVAILLLDQADQFLRDPKRDILPDFRKQIEPRLKAIRDMMVESDEMEQGIKILREANAALSNGQMDYIQWEKTYGKAVRKAKEIHSKVLQRKQRRETQKAVKAGVHKDASSALKPPTTKAVTFDDVLAEMDPARRKLKEIENILREKFSSTFGSHMPVEVKFIELGKNKNGQPGVSLSELDAIRKNLAGAFATQIQAVFEQQRTVDELESNYNFEEDEEENYNGKDGLGELFGL